MSLVVWASLLLVLALALLVLEIFIPSAGLLSILAAGAVGVSIFLAFQVGPSTGVLFLAITVIGMPVLAVAMLRWWPHTPIGRLILIAQPESPDEVLPETEEYRGLKSLVGMRGIAKTKMLPSGAVRIEGRTYDALAPGVAIEAGQAVEVLRVDMNRLVVAPLEDDEASPAMAETQAGPDDPLERPLEELGLTDFEEPLNS